MGKSEADFDPFYSKWYYSKTYKSLLQRSSVKGLELLSNATTIDSALNYIRSKQQHEVWIQLLAAMTILMITN